MAEEVSEPLSERLRVNPYLRSTDITLPNTNSVMQELLPVPVLSGPGTGKSIFTLIYDELKKRDISVTELCLILHW